jgi:hypothetical protein
MKKYVRRVLPKDGLIHLCKTSNWKKRHILRKENKVMNKMQLINHYKDWNEEVIAKCIEAAFIEESILMKDSEENYGIKYKLEEDKRQRKIMILNSIKYRMIEMESSWMEVNQEQEVTMKYEANIKKYQENRY